MKDKPALHPAIAAGIHRRKITKRADLAPWDHKLRQQDPLRILSHSMRGRVPHLVTLKYERMCASAFGFFRGAAPIMASDLSLTPHTGIEAQLCGDAHVANLGAYLGPDGRLVFDINDFDETIRGPFEWDLKRMSTSILLAGSDAGLKPAACSAAVESFLTAYCDLIRCLAQMPVLDAARFQIHRLAETVSVSEALQKATRETPMHSLERLTEPGREHRIFRSELPTLRRMTGAEAQAVLGALTPYRSSLLPERQRFLSRFRPLDVAFKVVGTGSVGLRDYCIYLEGNGPEGPLFLQIKEEVASAHAPYLKPPLTPRKPAEPLHQGQRTAEGQRAMQLQSDPLLGWTRFGRRDYLVRQLNDHKATVDVSSLDRSGLAEYAKLCGELLARGHARSSDPRPILGYIGSSSRFADAILAYASAYASQTVADWKLLKAHHRAAPSPSLSPAKPA